MASRPPAKKAAAKKAAAKKAVPTKALARHAEPRRLQEGRAKKAAAAKKAAKKAASEAAPEAGEVTASRLTIGVDIGGTKVLGGVVDVDGVIVAQARRDTPADDVGKTLDFIVEVIDELADRPRRSTAVGIGAAGWIDATRSRVLFAPNLAWRRRAAAGADRRAGARCRSWWRTTATPPRGPSSATVPRSGRRVDGAGDRRHRHRRRARGRRRSSCAGAHGMAAEMGHIRVVPDGRTLRLRPAGLPGAVRQRERAGALRPGPRGADARATRSGCSTSPAAPSTAINGPLVTRAAREGDPASRAAFAELGQLAGQRPGRPGPAARPGDPRGRRWRRSRPASCCWPRPGPPSSTSWRRAGSLPVAPIVPAEMGNTAGVVGAADLARL